LMNGPIGLNVEPKIGGVRAVLMYIEIHIDRISPIDSPRPR